MRRTYVGRRFYRCNGIVLHCRNLLRSRVRTTEIGAGHESRECSTAVHLRPSLWVFALRPPEGGEILNMTANGWFQIGFYLLVIFLLTKPVGIFMTRVFNREKTFLDPVLRPIERVVYRLTGVDEKHEMRWTEYAIVMLLFSGVSMALLYLIERTQQWLPLNPQKMVNVPPALAFNTAASFTTNTNWQNYSGESTMSYFTQMAGLAYHNFTSAATGIVLALVIIRGLARKETDKLGNFWVDMTRCLLWVLLPLCLVGSLVLVSQGVVQNLKPYTTVELTEPQTVQVSGTNGKTTSQRVTQRVIAQGPV